MDISSYAYIITAPNPVGVGQKMAVVMWIDAPMPSAALGNDIRSRRDYTLTITKPDGKVENTALGCYFQPNKRTVLQIHLLSWNLHLKI